MFKYFEKIQDVEFISLFPAIDEAFSADREMSVDLILVWKIDTSILNNKK